MTMPGSDRHAASPLLGTGVERLRGEPGLSHGQRQADERALTFRANGADPSAIPIQASQQLWIALGRKRIA
ncbi:hypothetical protein NKI94_31930 [Mesorhizobium australicum]|uniref:hypothetical protein n=1 Tax=Mesorhizobium australicum TaxID=536018 RepID=UPI00333AF66A